MQKLRGNVSFIGLTFGQTCHDIDIAQSKGTVGSRFDNAVATRTELRSAIFERVSSMRATRKGERNPGFIAPHSPTLLVTTAMAARMLQASATLSLGP